MFVTIRDLKHFPLYKTSMEKGIGIEQAVDNDNYWIITGQLLYSMLS